MNMRRGVVMSLSILAGSAALVLTGCSPHDIQQSSQSQDASANVAEAQDTLPTSELYKIMGWSPDDSESAQKRLDLHDKEQDALVTCMAEQGFEYRPNYSSRNKTFSTTVDDRGELEQAEREGYNALPSLQKKQWGKEVAMRTRPFSHRCRRQNVMLGLKLCTVESIEDNSSDYIEYRWEEHGCLGRASHEVEADRAAYEAEYFSPGDLLYSDPQWTDLATAIEKVSVQVEQSPEVLELNQQWCSCMESKGYRYQDKWEIIDYLHGKRDKVFNFDAYADENGRLPEDVTVLEPDAGVLQAPQKEERELAMADVTCKEESAYWENCSQI